MSVVAIAPMTSRTPVPELPWSIDVLRLLEAADAHALDPPGPGAGPLDRGAEGPHRPAGVEHVLALEQAADPRLADRQRAEDQRAVRDRLVAGHLHPARSGPDASARIGFGSPCPATVPLPGSLRFPPSYGIGERRSIGSMRGRGGASRRRRCQG